MNTAEYLLLATLAPALVIVAAGAAGMIGDYRKRLMYTIAAAGLAGYCTLFAIALDMIDDEFASVVDAVETKYDVRVTESARGGGPDDLRTWTIDGEKRDCYLEDLPRSTNFRGYTDPVLRCEAPAIDTPELSTDD